MTAQRLPRGSGKIPFFVIPALLIVALLGYLSLMNSIHTKISSSPEGFAPPSEIQRLQDRIHYLETKVDSYLAYTKDPFLSLKTPATCSQQIYIEDIACPGKKSPCEIDNSLICIDNLPYELENNANGTKAKPKSRKKNDCVVYDFGIRESPDFGLTFTKQCDVVGFDPSPISKQWWKNKGKEIRKEHPRYDFVDVGAGGIDGEIELKEYDWGQVSIIEFPERVIDLKRCFNHGGCKYNFHKQESFTIPVRTMKTIMRERKHDRVHLLKLDVEGSEYAFLEKMIDDLSCRKVDQLILEWHHFDYDSRYGVTSNPQINVLVALLKERCGLEQYWAMKGWPSNQKLYAEMGMTLYYTLSSFTRTKWEF
mmetsp:Transcript_11403/g.32847  ORF Transcript_11403/g.32847 Transcript_11403/m.32847 type:complete len:366 (-) Transcript_11403:373-1470(-)|eukprot:CAMPEP_0172369978 /NCGR_PEP_ID=MMETSP1060-20121228/35450_1 /TAXON_ID=37318 /ORGANISM="Pseudo-nitzschia pungens, Strain cf. cingulata" /LENGTH=365 /DNA_ID=CAMNT_0013095081 /DNA_START=56 /DNA_END=1153 /DNA_ORIENTATION=+